MPKRRQALYLFMRLMYKLESYRTVILTPKQFIELDSKYKKYIESSEMIPPVLGENDFGKFKVVFKFTYIALEVKRIMNIL